MRTLRWVPFTFLAGLHGFAIFAPYAAVVMMIYVVARQYRRRDGNPTRPPGPPLNGVLVGASVS